MIQFGNSSVADIKFGSRQISKVYRGADLIWEKSGDWIAVRIGGGAADPVNNLILAGENGLRTTDADYPSPASFSFYGFYIQPGTKLDDPARNVLHAFNGVTADPPYITARRTSALNANNNTSESQAPLTVTFGFPEAWGEVRLFEVITTGKNSYNYSSPSRYHAVRKKVNGVQSAQSADWQWEGSANAGIWTSRISYETAPEKMLTISRAGGEMLYYIGYGVPDPSYSASLATNRATCLHEIQMTVLVRESKFRKWLTDNSLTL